MTDSRTVLIPGLPIAYPRTTVSASTGQRITPARYRHWLHAAALRIAAGAHPTVDVALAADVVVCSDGIAVTLRPSDVRRPRGIRGDLDNYVKSVLDAAQSFPRPWIVNDRQIVEIHATFDPDRRISSV